MEAKKEITFEKGPRTLTRTFVFYAPSGNSFITKLSKALGTQYIAIKTGASTHIEGVNVPVPRSTVIALSGPCAIKIIDRDVTTFFMISENGFEVRQGRWGAYKFELVETVGRFCKMQIGGECVEESIRMGRPACNVPPYTEEESFEGGITMELPGISFVTVESEELAEKREKLRVEREVRRDLFGVALKEVGATRGMGRLFGVKPEVTASLQTVKKVTTRAQTKGDDKPKPQRVMRMSSGAGKSESESGDPSKIAEILRAKQVSEQKMEGAFEMEVKMESFERRVEETDRPSRLPTPSSMVSTPSEVVMMLEKMRVGSGEGATGYSPLMKSPTPTAETLMHLPKPRSSEGPSSLHSPFSMFKLSEEYKNLAETIHQEYCEGEGSTLDLEMPLKLGSFEHILLTCNFPKGGLLPIFNVNSSSCEYNFAGFESVNKAILVSSGGSLVVLPIF
ncbi:NS2 [CHeRI orbivirus 2-2]|nr:NS2 [CHeRI orbivirus 2-2]